MVVQSDCGSSLSYNLTVSDTDSSSTLLFNSTNARVAVDGSDNYTVTIFASNGCPGLAKEIGEWMGTITCCNTILSLSVINTTCVTPSSTVSVHSKCTMSTILFVNIMTIRFKHFPNYDYITR